MPLRLGSAFGTYSHLPASSFVLLISCLEDDDQVSMVVASSLISNPANITLSLNLHLFVKNDCGRA